jgi:ATP-dependent DNA helicase RecG
MMLFSDPEKIVPGAYIKIGFFAPDGSRGENTINDVIYHDDVHGPLLAQADKVMEYLYSKYLKALISYNGIQRVENYMIPQDAMREILLNAIAHKYYPSGNPIQVKVYDDHITVMNEGFWPVENIKVEDIYTSDHNSYRNNPLIAEGLYMAGEIETWGSGFNKIRKACQRYGTPLPEVNVSKGSVTIYIKPSDTYLDIYRGLKKSAESAEKSAESAEKSADYPEGLKTRHKQILTAMETGKEYSAEAVGELIGLQGSRTRQLLKELIELGYLYSTGDTKGRKYIKK